MRYACEMYDPESGVVFTNCDLWEGNVRYINQKLKKKGNGLRWRVQLDKDGEKVLAESQEET